MLRQFPKNLASLTLTSPNIGFISLHTTITTAPIFNFSKISKERNRAPIGLRMIYNDLQLEQVDTETGEVVRRIGLSSRQWTDQLEENEYVDLSSKNVPTLSSAALAVRERQLQDKLQPPDDESL